MRHKLKRFFTGLGKRFGTADRLTAFLAVAIVCASLFTVVPAVASGGTDVDSNIGGTELSIARFSEIMSNAFNSTMSQALPNKGASEMYMGVIDKPDNGMGIHTIGNFLGFPGGNDNAADAGNVWTKGVDAASRVMTLESVAGFYSKGTKVDDLKDSNMAQYIVFGCALNSMGIDEFRDAQSASDGIRMIAGYAAYIFFILAYSASDIMSKVASIMNDFNIFAMFYTGGVGAIKSLVGQNSELLNNVESAVKKIYEFRFMILGIMLVALVWVTMVWKSKAYSHAATMQEKWRKFFMRIVVMAIGIPVVGMTYTECLKIIEAEAAKPKYNITNYIFQEFLDFEGWAKGSAKSFQVKDVGADTTSFTVVYDANNQTFAIGKKGGDAFTISEPLDVSKFVYSINEGLLTTGVTGSASDAIYVDTLYGTSGVGQGSQSYSDLLKLDSGTANIKAYTACRDLLLNYARSTTVSADTLNDYFLSDLADLSKVLIQADALDDANKAAAVNATVIEQLFGEDAANQRIWSYIKAPSDKWIYPKDKDARELILAELDGNQVVVELSGIAAVSGALNSDNSVKIGARSIMRSTLNPSARYTFATGTYVSDNKIVVSAGDTMNPAGTMESPKYSYTYDLTQGGMSPLALYNYMHTKFENGQITVYDPDSTTNAGVGMMHYSVTTPYSGIPEIVQLLFIICILFSVGIIGWVFGISLLMNTVVQTVKAIPTILKMIVGSLQGFVEGLLIVLSIATELAVTVLLYSWSIDIIDFLIKIIQQVVLIILGAFKQVGGIGQTVDPESYAIMSGIISMMAILWGTFNLIKWRRAITLSIKSILTHFLNQVFGTSAAMPTGANSGMLKAGAGLAAGAMVAGALADQGTLDDVVNDLTDSDLGSSLHDKLSEGDYEGAMQDIQDFASGNYEGSGDRGRSETSEAERALAEADKDIGGAFGASQQSLSDDQDADFHEKWDEPIAEAEEALKAAQESGDPEAIEEASENLQETLRGAAADKAAMQAENKKKAEELGVADYGDHLRAQKDGAGNPAIEGADISHVPQKGGEDAELDSNAQMAYDAARDGDAETLRTAADMYDENGLDAGQAANVDQAVLDGKSEEEIAEMVDGYAQENFGDDHDAVTAKMNEAAGRGNTATYGDSNPTSDQAPRTMSVQGMHGEDGAQRYGVTDNNTGDRHLMEVGAGGAKEVQGGFLPETPNTELTPENAAAYNAVASGDTAAMAKAAEGYSVLGTDAQQTEVLNRMAANGASATEIAAAADNFAQDNFGDNYAQVVSGMNAAAGREGESLKLAGVGSDGKVHASSIGTSVGKDGTVSYSVQDLGDGTKNGPTTTVGVSDAGGQSTYTASRGGESIVTTDFGSGGGAAGSTYGELREGMQTVANASGGMISVGSGAGGRGQMTVSEATAAMAGSMSGNGAGVRVGDVRGEAGVASHVSAVQSVIDQGVQAQPPVQQSTPGNVSPLAAGAIYGAATMGAGGFVQSMGGAAPVQMPAAMPAAQFTQTLAAPLSYGGTQAQAAVQAVSSGNTQAIRQAAASYSAIGTTSEQTAVLRSMAASGASATEIAAAANNFAQANFGDGYAEVVSGMNKASGRTSGSVSIAGIGSDGQMRTVDVGMQTDSGGNVSYKVSGAAGSKKAQTVEVQESESGGHVTYRGNGGKETIVTQDFGSGAGGATYGEIREGLRKNNASGVLLDQSGAGGGSGHITISEAAASLSAQTVMETTGDAGAAGLVRMGNVKSVQAMADHVTRAQQLLYGGQGGTTPAGGESGALGTAANIAMMQRAYDQMNTFLHSGQEVDPRGGVNNPGDDGDGTSGNIWGTENR